LTQQQGDNPAKGTLVETWHHHYRLNPDTHIAFATRVNPIIKQLNLDIKQICISPASWKLVPCGVDLSLNSTINKNTDTIQLQYEIAMNFIGFNPGRIHIFLDGARSRGGRAASAVCAPSEGFAQVVWLSDGSSVFTAELFALLMAIIYINKHIQLQSLGNKHNSNKYIFFRDSLCALLMLSGCKTGSNPELAMLVRQQIHELVSVQNISLILAWIPAHCGLTGNQVADSLAKNALAHPAVDRAIRPTTAEHLHTINTHTLTKWQDLWDHSNTGHHYRDLQPLVCNKSKFAYDRGWHRERVITKLRLGRRGLNHYLHKLTLYCADIIIIFLLPCKYTKCYRNSLKIKILQKLKLITRN